MQKSLHYEPVGTEPERCWLDIGSIADLVPYSGVCAIVDTRQIALFYLPDHEPCLFATANRDPIGLANVLSRGIIGDIDGEPVVASPLYKQHFSLISGRCLERDDVRIATYAVAIVGDRICLAESSLS